MSREGVDYSLSRPRPVLLVAAGKTFVCRYLAYLPNAKVLTGSELSQLHTAGLDVVLNWEQSASGALGGRSKGVEHAHEALKQANALGAPSTVPIYFSVDFDATASQIGVVKSYLAGAASVVGYSRVGVYGSYDVVNACVPEFAMWGWQTYAWSGGKISAKAHLHQYRNGVSVAGADCDLDRSLRDNFGAWKAEDMELSDVVWTSEKDANGHTPGSVPAGPRKVSDILGALDQRTSLLTNGGLVDDVSDTVREVGTDVLGALSAVGTKVDALAAGNVPSGVRTLSDADVKAVAEAVVGVLEQRLQS